MEYIIMLSKTGMEWVDNRKSTLLQLYILVNQGAITYKLNGKKDTPDKKYLARMV